MGGLCAKKQGELAAVKQNVALTTGMIGFGKIPLPDRWAGDSGYRHGVSSATD